jgi:hypothetical protein
MAQMIIPRADGSTALVLGRVAILAVGKTKVKFFIHDGMLSHFASGFRFGNLNDIKIRAMCAFGHHHSMTDREAAIALIDSVVARRGAAEVLDVINAAPHLNG